jgi:hypothetical protein
MYYYFFWPPYFFHSCHSWGRVGWEKCGGWTCRTRLYNLVLEGTVRISIYLQVEDVRCRYKEGVESRVATWTLDAINSYSRVQVCMQV